jgi:hypothetical protein
MGSVDEDPHVSQNVVRFRCLVNECSPVFQITEGYYGGFSLLSRVRGAAFLCRTMPGPATATAGPLVH